MGAEQSLGRAVAPRVALAARRLERRAAALERLELLGGQRVVGVVGQHLLEPGAGAVQAARLEVGHGLRGVQVGVVGMGFEPARQPGAGQVAVVAPAEDAHGLGDHGRLVFVAGERHAVVGCRFPVSPLVVEGAPRREPRLGVARVPVEHLLEAGERLRLAPGPEQHAAHLERELRIVGALFEQLLVEREGGVVVPTPGELPCLLLLRRDDQRARRPRMHARPEPEQHHERRRKPPHASLPRNTRPSSMRATGRPGASCSSTHTIRAPLPARKPSGLSSSGSWVR